MRVTTPMALFVLALPAAAPASAQCTAGVPADASGPKWFGRAQTAKLLSPASLPGGAELFGASVAQVDDLVFVGAPGNAGATASTPGGV